MKILLYADDTVIYFPDKNLNWLCEKLESGLETLWKWCNFNKLTIDRSKTKFESFKPKYAWTQPHSDIEVCLGGEKLEEADSYTYLGVTINKLLFDKFLQEKCNKINLRLHQLGKMRKYITSNIANIVYKQTIVPLFDYADFLIESGQNIYIDRLHNQHSKALRIIDCKQHEQYQVVDLEQMYRLLPLTSRRREHHCAIMYRLSKLQNNLDHYRPTVNLRSRKKVRFLRPKGNLESIEKSPMNRRKKLWDMIPQWENGKIYIHFMLIPHPRHKSQNRSRPRGLH